MATITGFTINTRISDLNPADGPGKFDEDGMTLRGTFTTDGKGPGLSNGGRIFVEVIEDGKVTYIPGGFEFHKNGTFTFTVSQETLTAAGVTSGDHVQFRFMEGDDVVLDSEINTTPLITITCFYPGTMIATPNGEVAVETLAIGDMVVRHDGSVAPIRWMGRNSVSMLFADKMKALPIRIKKDAIAANVPARDLLVSPDHAIFVDGILAQAGALVNGTSIVRETNVPTKFAYHHIELADHALIMAENTPAETFIDNVDRMAYDNWAEHEALYGDQPALVEMDLPRAKSQRQVPPATRKRLADRAVALGYTAVDAAVA